MSAPVLRVATRRSALARTQSTAVGRLLAERTGRQLELVDVTSAGDLDPAPLSQIGGTGVFVTAVRQAVLEGRADVAVHSLKDLPTASDERLVLAAVPPREDPRDVLVSRDRTRLADLAPGARVGTGSPRRRALLEAARPDIEVVDIRGNVDTRVARVLGPEADLAAVVLAAAGLSRLGRSDLITEHLDADAFVPAPGQGALAVEVAVGSELAADAAALDDPPTRAAVTAERSALAALAVGCSAPVGAHAVLAADADDQSMLVLRGVLRTERGDLRTESVSGPVADAEQLGRSLAAALLGDAPTDHTTHPTTDRGELIR